MKQKMLLFLLTSAFCSVGFAQEANPTATQQWPQDQQQKQYPQAEMRDGVPVYKVQVVGRDIPAVNYFHRSGSTKIGFQGTSLLPEAKGSAVVESRRGRLVIDAKFEGLRPANGFGVEYLTYVLWAITPEGRPSNLGEVLPDGSKSEITVTTPLQSFGLIVTAEPYYAVTMPSDVVVMENIVSQQTTGTIEPIDAHYELLQRGHALVAIDHQVPARRCGGHHHDGRLLPAVSQRGQQAALPLRLTDSQMLPSPVQLVKLQVHRCLLGIQYAAGWYWSFRALREVCWEVSPHQ